MKYILSFLFVIALIGCADEYNPEIGYNYDEVQQIITETSRVDTLYITRADKDTVVVSKVDTLVLNSVDTVLNVVRDTMFINNRDTVVLSNVDTVVVSKVDTVVSKDTVVVSKVDTVAFKDTLVITLSDTTVIINQVDAKLTCYRVETYSNGRISVCENDNTVTNFYETGALKSVKNKYGTSWDYTEYYESGLVKLTQNSSGGRDSSNQAGFVLYSFYPGYYRIYEYLNDTLLIKESYDVSGSGGWETQYYVNYDYASTDLVNIKTRTYDYINKTADKYDYVWYQELQAKDNSWRSSAYRYADGSKCTINLYVVDGYRENYFHSSDCGETWNWDNFTVPKGFDIY